MNGSLVAAEVLTKNNLYFAAPDHNVTLYNFE